MTDKLDLEAIKVDRSAGTDGPFSTFANNHGERGYTVAVSCPSGDFISWSGFDHRNGCTGFKQAQADARRIARVSDMEAALISQEAALELCEFIANMTVDHHYDCRMGSDGAPLGNDKISMDSDMWDSIKEDARTALAKAREKAPQ